MYCVSKSKDKDRQRELRNVWRLQLKSYFYNEVDNKKVSPFPGVISSTGVVCFWHFTRTDNRVDALALLGQKEAR